MPVVLTRIWLCERRACVAIEGAFASAATGGVIFRAATGFAENAIVEMREQVRRRLLRTFVPCGPPAVNDARAVAQRGHVGGFSVDGVYVRS